MDEQILEEAYYKDTAIDRSVTAMHNHSGYQFLYIKSGKVTINISDAEHIINAPAVILLNAFENHDLSSASADYKRYFFTMSDRNVDRIAIDHTFIELLKFRPQGFSQIIDISKCQVEIESIFSSIISEWENKLPYYNDKIINDISNLIIILYRLISPRYTITIPRRIIEIQSHIEKNYNTIDSINQLCEEYFVNKFYLSRSFKQYIGYTPKEYLTLTRLSAAKKALLATDLSVNEICYLVGFSDVNNFIKIFKEKYNTSPLKFRKLNTSNQ